VLSRRHVDLVVDHYAPDMVGRVLEFTGGEGVTVVFEHVGQATWQRSIELCAQGGTIVFAGATSGDEASMNVTYAFVKQVRLLGSRVGTLDDAHAALRHLNSGRFQPLVGATFALEELPAAHRALEEGQVAGKIVVRIG
jgi:NADPH:quinone reductase-like Zn-dependent oxidoreductase